MSIFLKRKISGTELFVKLIITIAVLILYMYVSLEFLPQGINYVFVSKSLKLALQVIVLIFIVFFIYFSWNKKRSFNYKNLKGDFYYSDLLLLLLPLTPIIQYILLNQDILSLTDSIMLLIIFLAISFLSVIVFPIVFGVFGSRKVLMLMGLSYTWMLFNMAALAADFNWTKGGSLKIQIPIITATFIACLLIYILNKKYLYIAIAVFFVSKLITIQISTRESVEQQVDTVASTKAFEFLKDKKMVKKPDIFLLTYDAYIDNEMMLQHNIDNSIQEEFLLKNGFYIYRGIYSVAPLSIPSMSSVLDIGIDESNNIRNGVSGNGVVQNILKNNGYSTYGIFTSDYYFQKFKNYYDYSFPSLDSSFISPYKLLTNSILEGEFRFDASYNSIDYYEFKGKKLEILAAKDDKPRFIYSHSFVPGHSQTSGKCRDNETELFKLRLDIANEEMLRDLQALLKSYPNAIIIVNGDHGPYLTKTCFRIPLNPPSGSKKQYTSEEINRFDLQDRYGTFLAIKWPDGAKIDHNKINILQDIFPAIFSYLFEDDTIYNFRMEQLTIMNDIYTCGVFVRNGVIHGGQDDGLLLFDPVEKQ